MAEVTLRRTGELTRTLFSILMNEPDGMRAKHALAALADRVELTPHECGSYPNGSRRFEQIVRFATVDTAKAGWLLKSKGTWTVTEAGRAAHARFTEPEAFYREARRLYRVWEDSQPTVEDAPANEPDDGTTSGRAAIETFEEAEEQAWQEIERFLQQMNPYDLQELVASLIKGMGYHIAWVAPPGRDGGMDIIAFGDPLGTRPPRIKVQVKRHAGAVAVDGLRSFLAVLGDDDVGIFVNTGGFTKDAEQEARTQESRRVTLVNLERLFDLWVEHYDDLDDAARRRMPLKPIYFLAPAE
jgi:restriction system protein